MSEKMNFHLYLGKKDYEILVWKNSLPPKCFKYFVEQILLSHINGHKILLPPMTLDGIEDSMLIGKPIHIVTENKQIISFLNKIECGDKSKLVKEILLYYIRESRDFIPVADSKKKKKKHNSQQITSRTSQNTRENAEQREVQTFISAKQTETTEDSIKSKDVIIPPISDKPKEKNNKNPMMQALFKMSGDE